MHGRVPVVARIRVQCLEDKWKHLLPLLCNQRDDVLVIPQEERAFCDLKVRRANAKRDACEERLHNRHELWCLDHLEDLLNFIEEKHLRQGTRGGTKQLD